jgi:hypothetical protein
MKCGSQARIRVPRKFSTRRAPNRHSGWSMIARPHVNGNLKLVDPNQANRVLAVWKNRTDLSILGALHVLYKLDEGRAGLLEEVIVSCLALVFAERLSARGC